VKSHAWATTRTIKFAQGNDLLFHSSMLRKRFFDQRSKRAVIGVDINGWVSRPIKLLRRRISLPLYTSNIKWNHPAIVPDSSQKQSSTGSMRLSSVRLVNPF